MNGRISYKLFGDTLKTCLCNQVLHKQDRQQNFLQLSKNTVQPGKSLTSIKLMERVRNPEEKKSCVTSKA